MNKLWTPVALFVWLAASACSSGNTEETKPSESESTACAIGEVPANCELIKQLDALRSDINQLPHFEIDSLPISVLMQVHQDFLDRSNNVYQQVSNDSALRKELSALMKEVEARQAAFDSLTFKQEVMQDITVSSKANASSVTLSEGMQKFPVIKLTNKSKKTFHTATMRFKLLDRGGNVIRELVQVVNTNKWEPAAFGAVFPRYYNGENRGIPLNEVLTENEKSAWDSTTVALINISW